jgi:hypothetical protein
MLEVSTSEYTKQTMLEVSTSEYTKQIMLEVSASEYTLFQFDFVLTVLMVWYFVCFSFYT